MIPPEVDYEYAVDGEWIEVGNDFTHICCDCGLSHQVSLRNGPRDIEMRVFRNDEQTDKIRTKENIKIS